jgi:TRAP transporter 4TM/12TM fusion protein
MTIPAMKKSGFSKEYAASIESCASVGGIFMPPIMGSVAFIMSDVVGIPYAEMIRHAVLPAIVYFAALFFAVDFRARKQGIKGSPVKIKEKFHSLALRGYNFFIPLAYLIFRLMSGRTAAKSGLETILLMLVLGLFNRRKKLNFKTIIESLITAVDRGLLIVSTMAMCGVLIGVINLTGITGKFSSYLIYVSDISVILTLVTVMVVTLFLGLAMGISSTYLIVAVLGGPILIGLGFEPLAVHMFILFFAAMATITPPVAITSYAAASIAGAPPMKVGFLSMKVGMVAYILPFVFIFKPALLLYGSLIEIVLSFVIALTGTCVLAMGLEGWLFGLKTGVIERVMLIISGIMIVLGQWVVLSITGGILMLLILYNIILKSKNKYGEEKEGTNEEV